jgi:thioredoxin reductase (NADPH)
MGAEPRRLGVPGELELGGRGVSTCGVCDGAFFKGEDVIVVGGGDSAMEDSIFISKFAEDLTIVHRRPEFRASKIMLERAREQDNISFKTPFVVEEFIAGDDGKLARVRLRNVDTGDTEEIEVEGAFVAIGHIPRSELVAGQVDTDENGYVLTRDGSTKTNLAGVFAVGDLVDHTYRQAVTAAGTGTMGALDAEWYLRDTPPSPEAHWYGHAGEAQGPLPAEPVEVSPS